MNTAKGAILLLLSAIALANVMAGEVIYFLMGPISESVAEVSVVIPVSKPEDIEHARDLIINPPRDGKPNRYQAVLRIRGGKNGINRDYLDPRLPEWSWHIEEVLGFGDITAEGIQTTPTYLEERFDGSMHDGTSNWAFPSYSIAREIGPYPLYLSIMPEGDQLQFYWSGLGTNHVYTLEYTESPAGTNWTALPGADWPLNTNHWILPQMNETVSFYRVKAEELQE